MQGDEFIADWRVFCPATKNIIDKIYLGLGIKHGSHNSEFVAIFTPLKDKEGDGESILAYFAQLMNNMRFSLPLFQVEVFS